MRVLIVEDDLLVAVGLDGIVDEAGHTVVGIASSVEQALAHAARADVALIDLRLADGSSGGSLARRLMDRFGVKVIFVTASPDEIGYGQDGAVDIVLKPYTENRIKEALAKAEAAMKPANLPDIRSGSRT